MNKEQRYMLHLGLRILVQKDLLEMGFDILKSTRKSGGNRQIISFQIEENEKISFYPERCLSPLSLWTTTKFQTKTRNNDPERSYLSFNIDEEDE